MLIFGKKSACNPRKLTLVQSYFRPISLILVSANPTKWSSILKSSSAVADELFECVRPFCGVCASRVDDVTEILKAFSSFAPAFHLEVLHRPLDPELQSLQRCFTPSLLTKLREKINLIENR